MPPTKRTTAPASPSLLTELYEFATNHAQTPYGELGTAFIDAGWIWRVRETGVTPMADATAIMHFDLLVGHDAASLEHFDSFSMRMPAGPGPVSFAARVGAAQTIIFLVTGRTPPMPNAPAASDARPAPGPNGREVHIDMGDGDVAIDLPDEPEAPPAIKLVERMEPDGLPIMRDFDDIDPREATASEIVEEFITLVDEFMHTASLEQIAAFGSKNSEALGFVTTMGTDAQKSELLGIINARRAQLQPRRRSTAAN